MQKCNENAADRYSYLGEIHTEGERNIKTKILSTLPQEWSKLHTEGYIHIHDLDAYGLTYNCLTLNVINKFPYSDYINQDDAVKIIGVFNHLTRLLTALGNEQSGGMAFANFDDEMATIFDVLKVKLTDNNTSIIRASIRDFILWCNNTHSRMGKTSYYVTLNIGLAHTEFARFIAQTVIEQFEELGDLVFKPNIVFKVASAVNGEGTKNHYLLKKALLCSAKKMIPTYLLCDSLPNIAVAPEHISVMGCRTRVVDDLFGEKTSIGRGNIANISINLPRLALEVVEENNSKNVNEKMQTFIAKWDKVASITKDILLDRYEKVCNRTVENFPTNLANQLWCCKFKGNLKEVFKHGTLSIGFIGLSEAMEVLCGEKFYRSIDVMMKAVGFVKHMRDYCDFLKNQYNLNFSLLATSGELISGRFLEIDKKLFDDNKIFKKGYYTNSFHIDVDSDLIAFKKIQGEGVFHQYCNGGCITYVELGQAPISNDEGLQEYINCAVQSGVHYMGFNFPKDVCNECNTSGIFDKCPNCGSSKINRIRRVSGYLEILDGFTKGKKQEEKNRRAN